VRKALLSILVIACGNIPAFAETIDDSLIGAVRQWRQLNERDIVREFREFVQIPNESRDKENILRNAKHLIGMMEKRGLSPRLLETTNAAPVVYGEWTVPGATSTFVFYGHYDAQPVVDPKEWADPPFSATVRDTSVENGGKIIEQLPSEGPLGPDWRILGRSAADDKAGIMTILSAVSALRATGVEPLANLRFVFEGEEETGSEHLGTILSEHKVLLHSDGWIICDSPQHSSGRQSITFGVRGVYGLELTVHGAIRNLHSGLFGNWAPNPAMMLAQLLATMKDAEGRILIEGFYDSIEPLGDLEKQAISKIPASDAEQMSALKLARTDGGGARREELFYLPTLNVSGLASGKVGGQVATIIPASATAAMDIRLVKGVTRESTLRQLTAHIRKQGYYVTSSPPTDEERLKYPRIAQLAVIAQGYEAVRTPMDGDFARKVVNAVETVRANPILFPSGGGSLPLDLIEHALNVPIVMVPSTNADNNQHAKNENLRLGNLWDSIEVYAKLLMMH
jgi:acetylornithine deacetylase/succinyl-diaminopimelate desuccinylase-like protein